MAVDRWLLHATTQTRPQDLFDASGDLDNESSDLRLTTGKARL